MRPGGRWRRHAGSAVAAGVAYGLLTLTPVLGDGEGAGTALVAGLLFAVAMLLVGVAGDALADRWRARR
ncbi:hypothetical protein [Vallicoccus soli]|uniref:Uncharacterized protein n=1 Tax=Vallicoccus soli TaxID=2339232 RepID=A0A3A3ZF72_9ACTN|nr:hypothetical protein [Vallicoccus soli]RJK93711.1 hypothetical protein D5H78_15295 [Vallicoccus soli]